MFSFVADPPRTVGELTHALGAELDAGPGTGSFSARGGGSGLAWLTGRYWWDMHHEDRVTDPAKVRGRQLHEWSASFHSGRAQCLAALRAAYGEPGDAPQRHSYGPFFVDLEEVDGFGLEWFSATPDWAKPPPDLDVQAAIVREIAAGRRRENVKFDPPMPALAFAEAFGASRVIAESVGIYMAGWRLVAYDGTDCTPLRAGDVEISPHLRKAPTGERLNLRIGPFAHSELGPEDTVGNVEFRGPRAP